MNDITKRPNKCQVEPKRKITKSQLPSDIRSIFSISRKYTQLVNTWSKKKQLLANRIIEIASWNKGHQYTRQYISNSYGYAIKTVSRMIKILSDMGLITSKQLFKRANKYSPGVLAHNPYIRQSLVQYLPAMRLLLCLSFLLSVPNVSLSYNKNIQENSAQIQQVKKAVFGEYNTFTRRYLEYLQPLLSDNAPKKGAMPMSSDLFRPLLGSLSSLELTDHGKAELEAYPDEAIRLGDARLARSLKAGAAVASPLGLIISVARAYCKENNIQPDARRTGALMRELSIDPSSPKFAAIKLSKQTLNSSGQAAAVKKSVNNWKAQIIAQAKPYWDEQAELSSLSREERKARIDISVFKTLSPSMQQLLIKLHPFPDAAELIAELLAEAMPIQPELAVETPSVYSESERAAWLPLIPKLSNYSQEHRAISLKSRGMERFIPLVEQLIAEISTTEFYEDDTIWQEI